MNNNLLPDIGAISTATINGLSIRYARSGCSTGIPILMTSPWPESIYSFHRVVPQLGGDHPLFLVDLPGYGQSQSRQDVMAPEAMGDFLLAVLAHFEITRTHVVAPDVGTPAVLFAAAKNSAFFESLVVGGGAMRAEFAAGALKDLIHTPLGALSNVDGAIGMKDYLTEAAKLTPAAVVDDFRAASAGRRLEEAVQYVRNYIPDLPKLEPKLSSIRTPVLIIAGKNDPIVPPVNGQFLADRLPVNRYMLLDASHRIWEEARAAYAEALVAWFEGDYATVGKK
jgi:pimeloyl-ACP methyl ester carboxylesterase